MSQDAMDDLILSAVRHDGFWAHLSESFYFLSSLFLFSDSVTPIQHAWYRLGTSGRYTTTLGRSTTLSGSPGSGPSPMMLG